MSLPAQAGSVNASNDFLFCFQGLSSSHPSARYLAFTQDIEQGNENQPFVWVAKLVEEQLCPGLTFMVCLSQRLP